LTTIKGSLRASLYSKPQDHNNKDGVAEKFLLPITEFNTDEPGGLNGGCHVLNPFNTVLLGRPDFLPKIKYGPSLVVDMVRLHILIVIIIIIVIMLYVCVVMYVICLSLSRTLLNFHFWHNYL
jgi:hypothetical protein